MDGNGWKGADNLWSNHQRSQPGVQLQVVLVHETLNQTSHAQHAQDAQDVKFVDFTEPRKRQQVSLPLYHCQKIAFCCQLVATCVAVCCFMFHVVSWCEALVRNQFRSENFQPCPSMPWRTTPTSSAIFLRAMSQRCYRHLPTFPTLPGSSDQFRSEILGLRCRSFSQVTTEENRQLRHLPSRNFKSFNFISHHFTPKTSQDIARSSSPCIRNDWLNDW